MLDSRHSELLPDAPGPTRWSARERDGSPGWSWAPQLGRWSPRFGRPERPALVRLSTDLAPARDRYDFWRDVAYYHFDAAARPAGALFHASAIAAISSDIEFFAYRSDAVEGQRTAAQAARDGGDCVSVGLVLAGERLGEQADDQATQTTAGAPFIFDAGRPTKIAWSRHQGVHIVLRRPLVTATLGGDIPSASRLAEGLRRIPIFDLMRDHMLALGRLMTRLDASDRAFALDTAGRLVRHALLQAAQARPANDLAARSDLFAAAVCLIERNLAHPALGAAAIARWLGCSRATLYRAFRDHGQSVGAIIQAMRFEAARRLLETAAPRASIGDIALACGVLDTVNFSRRFRARYGASPTEFRSSRYATLEDRRWR